MEDDDDEQVWDVGLGLSIGLGDQYYYVPKKEEHKNKRVACLGLSFPLDPKDEELAMDHISELYKTGTEGIFFSSSTDLEEEQNDAANGIKHNKCSRKKLRLSKEQTSMLEDSFKLHTTLNTVQKQALAERLNLKPRQVEVWFQNRRARTKLKQTEVDCGFLKKCSENLSDENRRLKKEIQELVALKLQQPAPLYIQLPKAATLTMCPSCHNFFKVGGDDAKKIVAAIMEGCAPP